MKRLFVFTLLLALGMGISYAQETTSGVLEGLVLSEDGTPIVDAIVTAMGPQGIQTTDTGRNGQFVFRGLTPGSYKVKAEAPGYSTVVQSDVEVYISRKTQLPFTLTSGVTEEITVVSQAPIVDLKSTTTGETIKINDFAPYVPMGRTLAAVVGIAPGVADGGTIGGQNQSISGSSGLENAYFIDGVNVTNSGFGALGSYSIVYGSLGSGVTYSFLEEVQVKTGGFEAEFGQAGGGVVNSVVKSGSNSFNLDFSWYEEPTSMEGSRNDRLDTPNIGNVVDTERRDISLTLGGPAVKDKLFYFGAYNYVETASNWKLTSGNPDEAYDLDGDGTADDFFDIGETITGGRTPESVERVRSIDNYAAKISWFITPNHKVEATAFGDPSTGDVGPQAPTQFLRNLTDPLLIPDPATGATGLDYGGQQISLKYQGVWTSNFFTEILFATKENNFTETGPGTTFRSFFDVQANTTFGGAGFYEDKLDEAMQFSLKNTHVFGPVELRYGFQYDDLDYSDPSFRSGPTYTAYFAQLVDGVTRGDGSTGTGLLGDGSLASSYTPIQSSTGAAVDIDAPGDYNVTRTAFEPLSSVTNATESNIFAQVSWDVISNLTIKAGLRWTEQELTGAGSFDLPISTLDSGAVTGLGTTEYRPKNYTFDAEIAPRFGVTWDMLNNGKLKLYANYGEYFQRVPSDLAIRQFSNEVGVEGEHFSDADLANPLTNNACWIDSTGDGTYDTAMGCHLIESMTGAEPGVILDGTIDPDGDPIEGNNPATKLPYTKEMLIGWAWEMNDFSSLELRYIDRSLGRVLEDVQFASNEQIWNEFYGSLLLPNYGAEVFSGAGVGSFGAYVLANPGTNVDPNLFPPPARDYSSFELIFNRRFNNNWMLYANYRYATLEGNYEGSYRNDNGQSDPFITSLFDIPAASYNNGVYLESDTLKGQYISGPLNTDRAHILNGFLSYQFDFGLNLGARTTWQTGQPRFPLFAHPTYRNAGEIPGDNAEYWWLVTVDTDGDGASDGFGTYTDPDSTLSVDAMTGGDDLGNGDVLSIASGPRLFSYQAVKRDYFGRNPARVTFDFHASYDIPLGSRKAKLTLLLDIFNLFNENTALTFDNNIETRPGNSNPDYLKANLYGAPRNTRLGLMFTF